MLRDSMGLSMSGDEEGVTNRLIDCRKLKSDEVALAPPCERLFQDFASSAW